MQEQINDLLIKIEKIAYEKEEYEIIKLVEDIVDILGYNYEIYKLED